MGILSSIGRLFKAIWRAIVKFIKKYWLLILAIILIVCVIYFAPLIAGWLTSVGAPTWLSGAFTWIGSTITPLLSTAWSGITAVAGGAWDAFSSASIGTKAALLLGAAAAIAPEETAALISDAAALAVDTVTSVAGGLLGGLASSPIGLALLGLGLWWLLGSSDDDKKVVIEQAPSEPRQLGGEYANS